MPAMTPLQRPKMSLSQTYYLAHTARGKLSREAGRADHDLRVLVGHANLLDGLMLDLADAERDQEAWFHQTVKAASEPKKQQPERRITWADSLPSTSEEDELATYEDSDSDNDDDISDDEDMFEPVVAPRSVPAATHDDDMELDDEDSEDEELQLTRIRSRSSAPSQPLPELLHESDSDDSDDDHMPPSPDMPLDLAPAPHSKDASTLPPSPEEALYEQGFYLPQRTPIAAY